MSRWAIGMVSGQLRSMDVSVASWEGGVMRVGEVEAKIIPQITPHDRVLGDADKGRLPRQTV